MYTVEVYAPDGIGAYIIYKMADLQSHAVIRSLNAGELDLWLQFLADAFRSKYPNVNMLELFRMLVNKDKYFQVEDVLLLG